MITFGRLDPNEPRAVRDVRTPRWLGDRAGRAAITGHHATGSMQPRQDFVAPPGKRVHHRPLRGCTNGDLGVADPEFLEPSQLVNDRSGAALVIDRGTNAAHEPQLGWVSSVAGTGSIERVERRR
jgi:hypothetical protein